MNGIFCIKSELVSGVTLGVISSSGTPVALNLGTLR